MAKYKVIRPWSGVRAGQIVELEKLNPALKPNVFPLSDSEAKLVPATPAAAVGGEGGDSLSANERKAAIKARLEELEIEFDGRKGADDLAELLPEGELEKLFPAE